MTTILLTPNVEISLDDDLEIVEITATKPPTRPPLIYRLPIEAGQQGVDWFIGSYVDAEKADGDAADFRGGFMTYDWHKGTDFFIRDLDHMETGVPVLAARSGTVVELHDGENDYDWEGKGRQNNFIKITHDDGSFAFYSHLKRDSLVVRVGDTVAAGDPLVLVGNSGLSSGHPHLHFEVHAANGRTIDIFGENLADFEPLYPDKPFIFAAGAAQREDPHLFGDLSRYTPTHTAAFSCAETPYFWYKIVGMAQGDRLRTLVIYPDGVVNELPSFVADQDYRFIYWVVYDAPLPPGTSIIRYFFNDDIANVGEMALWTTCE